MFGVLFMVSTHKIEFNLCAIFLKFLSFIESNLPKRIAHMQLGLEREISEEEEEIENQGEVEYEYVTDDFEVIEEVLESEQPQNPMMDEEESRFIFNEA